jgi:hypothetical protein
LSSRNSILMKRIFPRIPLGFLSVVCALAILASGDAIAQKKKQPKGQPKEELKRVEKQVEPRKHQPTDTVGVINGDVITYSDFRRTLSDIVRSAARDSMVSEADFTKYVNASWDQLVETILVQQYIVKNQIKFSDDEVKGELVNDPPQFLKKQFTDETGQFYPDALHAALYDPAQDSVVSVIVEAQRILMESDALKLSIAPNAKSPEEREKAYRAWLTREMNQAKTVDNRLRFGYY